MPARFVNVDRDTPLLLPPDLRQWIPEDHLAHYILDAVEALSLTQLQVNERGTGDEQYPPRMMLSVLIYCYATGTFSSRQIERATYTDVAVRFLSGDTHPDHDTICEFRHQNKELLGESFVQVLALARELKVLKVGQITVAVDGSKVLANASKHAAVSYQRAAATGGSPTVGQSGAGRQRAAGRWAEHPRRDYPPPRPHPEVTSGSCGAGATGA
jgi:transposase